MANTLVVNMSQIPQTPDIILKDGRKTQIRVYPRQRCGLPEGALLCPRWVAMNPNTVQLVPERKTYVAPKVNPAAVPHKDEE